jgi:beta-carotene ketolase (CrtW type)
LNINSHKGLIISLFIFSIWLISLIFGLFINIFESPLFSFVLLLVRIQLNTGIFIISHDSMHGVLFKNNIYWNDFIGKFMLFCYAALPYDQLFLMHQRHHHNPTGSADPDFPNSPSDGLFSWYKQFMVGYLGTSQMLSLISIWCLLALMLGPNSIYNILLFCILPLFLSSFQLFIFGTYLPHRKLHSNLVTHTRSIDLPVWLSLLACYHFGYHQEHHDHPTLSWFELPAARKRSRLLAIG